jgi:hypothetical protein
MVFNYNHLVGGQGALQAGSRAFFWGRGKGNDGGSDGGGDDGGKPPKKKGLIVEEEVRNAVGWQKLSSCICWV